MDNKIKDNIKKIKDIFKLLKINISLDNVEINKKLSSEEIKLELASVIKNVEDMKEKFNDKLKNKIFLTKDEYNELFINYLKTNKISTLKTQDLKYRKQYYDFYIKTDNDNSTQFEKLVNKLNKNKNTYFGNNTHINRTIIELNTIMNQIKKLMLI